MTHQFLSPDQNPGSVLSISPNSQFSLNHLLTGSDHHAGEEDVRHLCDVINEQRRVIHAYACDREQMLVIPYSHTPEPKSLRIPNPQLVGPLLQAKCKTRQRISVEVALRVGGGWGGSVSNNNEDNDNDDRRVTHIGSFCFQGVAE